ncbi:type VI secretion system-associated protein TagF [Paraburkholderia panacisoli]|uniref:Type VI secretion system-associated protein TagF n=1 Tax=Paraburkholderia panacisoli TaxID=2603818 RepID=A0A5B0G8E4_9BURK|nr:type VI secretion system-associated protein TagF [Paraburkholderia panacisoli]KAA0999694.1 type VI secretion system-associated protein TagF [Paraburkholderia panacisoli]
MNDALEPEPSPASVTEAAVAGWYGKLPSLGDFATRRLSSAFVDEWDSWLCERLAETKLRLGERWLSVYLTCPVWHFFAMPGAIALELRECWTGVLMASVDRVGRHFPLTIAAALPRAPATGSEIDAIWQWLGEIEKVALAALDFDYTIERFDAQLAALPIPTMVGCEQSAPLLSTPWTASSCAEFSGQLAKQLAPVWQTGIHGLSLWSTEQRAHEELEGEPAEHKFTIWPSCGMPDNELFTNMLLNREP